MVILPGKLPTLLEWECDQSTDQQCGGGGSESVDVRQRGAL
jgi:hypothetical protein